MKMEEIKNRWEQLIRSYLGVGKLKKSIVEICYGQYKEDLFETFGVNPDNVISLSLKETNTMVIIITELLKDHKGKIVFKTQYSKEVFAQLNSK